jgi:1,4-dihydroxy-2-naphthoate octaprenyltransferase
MKTLRLMIQLARPHFLLGGFLLFALGAGIARYLGTPIDWGLYFLGQAWITLVQLSTHFLNEYFDAPADAKNPNRTLFSGGSGTIGPEGLPRAAALWGAVGSLGAAASVTFLLIQQSRLDFGTVSVMVLIFLGAFFYAVPPVKLASSGYGELTTSVLVAVLVPAFALLLQFNDLHRLLPMTTFPLAAIHMAMLLAFELPDYATDLKFEKRTIMVRLGWEAGMRLHNLLILTAYLLLSIAMMLDFPFLVALPALLTLPLGLLQVWSMNRIAAGARPNWTTLTLTGLALFAIMAYLLTFSFWTR